MSEYPEPPEKLQHREIWLAWHYEERKDSNGEPYRTKVPDNPHERPRSGTGDSTDPAKRVTFEEITTYAADYADAIDGIGFAFPEDDLLCGVDLDDVVDTETGEVREWATDVIDTLDSYTEYSPSGGGFHTILFGIKPGDRCKRKHDGGATEIESYDEGRFFTYTGDHVEDTPFEINQRNDELSDVYYEFLEERDDGDLDEYGDDGGDVDAPDLDLTDEEVLEKARNAENGAKFCYLEEGGDSMHDGDTSAADQAFCNLLAFWTGGERHQMDRLFRNSARMRSKWDEDRGTQTYGELTIDTAITKQTEFYDPGGTPPTSEKIAGDGGVSAASPQGENGEDAPPEAIDTPLAAAILDEPDEWIDGETCTITVRETTDYDAEEAQDLFEHPDELPDSETAELAMGLSGEVQAAFKDWNDNPEEWDVDIARQSDPWASVRAMFTQEELRDKARYKAVNLTDGTHDLVTERKSERMYCYDPSTGVYQENGDAEIREFLDAKLQAQFKRSRVSNVLYQLESRTFVGADELGGPKGLVCAKNGVLDLEAEAIKKFSPDHLFLSHLGANYDPEADCPQWKAFLGESVRNVDIAGLQEFVGYCLLHWDQPYKKALMLLGPKNSGKSTFLNVVNELLGGRENVASESLHDIVDSRWGAARLHGKFANIYSDLDASVVEQSGRFKTIVGNDKQIAAEFKGEDKFDFEPVQKLLFSANRVPEARDADGAFYDRWLHATFPNSVPEPEQDPELEDKLLEELDGILNWALEGYHRIVDQQGRFTGERSGEEKQEFWDAYGDSIRRFKHNCLDVTGEPDDMEATADVYNAYLRFCDSLGVNKETKTMLTRELKKDDEIDQAKRTINGSRQQGYVGCVLNEHADALEEDSDDDHHPGGLGEFGGE